MNQALTGIIFCSDRGYWTAPLILLILGLGGIVFGTLQRMEWVPYTYNQSNRRDKRTKIQKKFGHSVVAGVKICSRSWLGEVELGLCH